MKLDGGWRHEGVCSPFWRVFYDFTPGAWVVSDGHRFALGPDQVAVMPDGVPFDCGTRMRVDHLWLHFSIYRMLPDSAPAVFALPAGPALRAVAAELRARLATGDESSARHLGTALLHLVFADHTVAHTPAVPERLRRVLQRIDAGLGGPINNRLLAEQAGMSIEAFIRWFRGRTGRTPAAQPPRPAGAPPPPPPAPGAPGGGAGPPPPPRRRPSSPSVASGKRAGGWPCRRTPSNRWPRPPASPTAITSAGSSSASPAAVRRSFVGVVG